MLEMIEERKGSAVLERRDLLSNLVQASMEKDNSQTDFKFTHRDLLGNIFIFMLAGKLPVFGTGDFPLNCGRGHDTTASVLSFAVALLATHPEEQEELYKHVRSVVPDGHLPVSRDSYHAVCSLYPIRPITMFHDSLGCLRSSTRLYAFSLQ
jgi:cytochrome P450